MGILICGVRPMFTATCTARSSQSATGKYMKNDDERIGLISFKIVTPTPNQGIASPLSLCTTIKPAPSQLLRRRHSKALLDNLKRLPVSHNTSYYTDASGQDLCMSS
jgi:hypothetical protein